MRLSSIHITWSLLALATTWCIRPAFTEDSSPAKIALPIPDKLDGEDSAELKELEKSLKEMSYGELESTRLPRKMLIDYLIAENKIRESPKGTIDFLAHLNDVGRKAVREENLTRKAMFELIAKRERRTFASIGREFHRKVSKKAEEDSKDDLDDEIPDLKPSLRIASPSSIRETLLPSLVAGYMESLGYISVKTERKELGVSRIIGRRSFGKGFIAVDIHPPVMESSSSSSSKRPRDGMIEVVVGGSAGNIPPNTISLESLAIVVHPDNPLNYLTVSQVADIFAGKYSKWGPLRTGDDAEINVLLPETRPGLKELFREMVLVPQRENFPAPPVSSDSEGTGENTSPKKKPTGNYLKQLAKDPNAIAFCHPSEITDKMKAVPIKVASDAMILTPSSINIKALDYPLIRFISLKVSGTPDSFIDEFIAFAQGDTGQLTLTEAGYFGNQSSGSEQDENEAVGHRKQRLEDPSIPDAYKKLIENADRLRSPANFRFASGGSEFKLTDYSEQNLERLIKYLSSTPEEEKVILIGFADSYGRESANLTYSEKRANSIAERLSEKGISNVKIAGMGEEMPVADNDTESGRSANQRVEVWIER